MIHLSPITLQEALRALAGFLEAEGAFPETLVVVGGSALISMGFVSRATKDVDVMARVDPERGLVDPRPLSEALRTAAEKVARELQLHPDWLNTGPADQVLAGLPEGFLSRLTRREYGPFLTILLPDRFDLIHLKFFAVTDQGPGRHAKDLHALAPTDEELLLAARWVLTQDAGEDFPLLVRNTLTALGHGHIVEQL